MAESSLGSTPRRAPAAANRSLYGVPAGAGELESAPIDAADEESPSRMAIGSYDGRVIDAVSLSPWTMRRIAVGGRVMSWIFTTSPVWGATTILLLPA